MPQLVRIHLEQPIAASLGDKGILRRFSPQDLIGGVTFLATGDGGNKPQELFAGFMRHICNGILKRLC